jgi:hypothetical protein
MAAPGGMSHAWPAVMLIRIPCLALLVALLLPPPAIAQEVPFDPAQPTALGLLGVVRELGMRGDIASPAAIERAFRIDLALWLVAQQSPETARRYWLFYRPIVPFLVGPSVGFTYDKQSKPPPGPATDLHARLLLGNVDSFGCARDEDVSRILTASFDERPRFEGTGSREFMVAETASKVVWITVQQWNGCVGSISIVQTN